MASNAMSAADVTEDSQRHQVCAFMLKIQHRPPPNENYARNTAKVVVTRAQDKAVNKTDQAGKNGAENR